MKSLRSKILLYMILVGLIPVFFLGAFYYRTEKQTVTSNVEDEVARTLMKIDGDIFLKTSRIQNAVDVLFNNYEFQKSLRNDELGSEHIANNKGINEVIENLFKTENQLETVIVFQRGGGTLVVGKQLDDIEPVNFVMNYNKLNETSGVVSWLGLNTSSRDTKSAKLVSGTVIRDSTYLKDQDYLASFYFVYPSTFFNYDSQNFLEYEYNSRFIHPDKQNVPDIYIYDRNMSMIYSSSLMSDIVSDFYVDDRNTGFISEKGSFLKDFNKDKTMFVYYTSTINGWKYMSAIPYSMVNCSYKYVGYMTIIYMFVLVLLFCLFNYLVVKKLTAPVREMHKGMSEVSKGNLNIQLNVRSKDELGDICLHFNDMTKRVRELMEMIRIEEQRKKESDIMMLEYQINPHFLYNTLAVIRFEAILSGADKAGEMLAALSRLLRNTLKTCNKLKKIDEEMQCLNDYISIIQYRYDNKLDISVSVSDDLERCVLPGMLVQPIIENAITHGLNRNFDIKKGAKLRINFKKEDSAVVVSICDNGRGIDDEKLNMILEDIKKCRSHDANKTSTHMGLHNIHRRVVMMYGEEFGINISSKAGCYTKVVLKIPYVEENIENSNLQN